MQTVRQAGVEVIAAMKISDHSLSFQGFETKDVTDEMFFEIANAMRNHFENEWHPLIWNVAREVFRRHGVHVNE